MVAAYGASALLLVGMVFAAWLFFAILSSASRQATMGDLAFSQQTALLELVNQETGVRGYVATGDARFLQIYYASGSSLRSRISEVSQYGSEFPDLHALAAAFVSHARTVQRYFASEIVLTRSGRQRAAIARLAYGKALFDGLRRANGASLTVYLQERTRQRRATLYLSRFGAISSLAFCFVVVVLALAYTFTLRRSHAYRASSLRDALTGAGNRGHALREIHGLLQHGTRFGIVFIDLDGFKKINDNHGHAAGDSILKAVVGRLQSELRDQDTVCRLGGDEFVCIVMAPDELEAIAERLQHAVNRPYSFNGDHFVIGSSAGYMRAVRGVDAATMLERADRAMYQAKRRGGGVWAANPLMQ
ncbi:MAG TPA: diguanylate cyclase [Candidatus Baltobacteraceae bacterium]|nr:diguanylate cyclase [Candidatus Baltobacteraceae bacterium]